ncbi:hypothetical protein [Streptacidiphilus sp. MAP5-3]|uniref:hypothetical protein n=1 Tax=unclassified Streptacidiphilus TaxID=2643834 RepID=UPI0035196B07
MASATAATTHFYLARDLAAGRTTRDAAEAWMRVRTVPLREAVSLVRSGVISDAGSVAALLLADQTTTP